MNLIIDTSSADIKLLLGDKTRYIQTDKQSLDLPTSVQNFLNELNVKFSDLTAIGIIVGPGSFTGIRLGIAYAKGLSIGLNIPIIPINKFEIYLEKNPDAFVALDSGKNDLFVAANDLHPQIMDIETVETRQMDYPKTVGHLPYDLLDIIPVMNRKINTNEPVIPLYMRASYAELNCKC